MSVLNPDQWQAVSPLLDQALTLTGENRARWLEALRAENPAMAAQLEELLSEHRAAAEKDFLNKSPDLPQQSSGLAGQVVGAYRLISLVGLGGMGAVWLAERSDGRFERKAAVKFLSAALVGQGGEERFKREGAILGRFSHANIAEMLDAGVAGNGQPYIILEYVEGEAIDRYCDAHQLDIKARISLFLEVLSAVTHAHANLIVHRDIKPSNVLVNQDGQVKLLDFGIAKLLEAEGQDAPTLLTETGESPLTPEYAAPEQVTGGPITTATDIYSLGVLLYQLLSGRHPAGTALRSPAALVKAIVDTDPSAPSDIVHPSTAGTEEITTNAAKRGSTPERLYRLLRGDLDTIVGKALKKNPEERYASVSAMADDLRRYLKHEPISARPDTFAYRATKFVRRNRVVVTLTATAIALVIGSLSVGLYVANRERRIAEERFAQVHQLVNKFIDLDQNIRGLPGATQIRMQIVTDSLQYLRSLASQGRVDDDLALEIAFVYVRVAHAQGDPTSPNLGLFPEAEASLNDAAGFVDPVLAKNPNNPRALFIATTIAHDRMILAERRGDREEHLKDAANTASLIERFMNTHPVERHDLYSMRYFYLNVAGAYVEERHMDDAIRFSQLASEVPVPEPRSNDLRGGALEILAMARWQSGDLDGALKTSLESVALKRAEAEAHGGHAALRINLANGLVIEGAILGRQDAEPSLGRSREALAKFQEALEIAEDLSNKDPLDNLGRHNAAVYGLEVGNALRHIDPRQALAVYDHALTRIREAKSNSGTERDEAELRAGSSYPVRWLGNGEEAKQRVGRALELLRKAGLYPTDKVEPMSDVYDALRAQADGYAESGQIPEAIAAYQELLDKLMAWKPDVENDLRDAICISRTWTALAGLQRRNGRKDAALQLEAQRAALWNHWNAKLPNAQFLLRQSLSQITPSPALSVEARR